MKKFICTRAWKRNSLNDIIEEYEYNRYPEEIKTRNFKEYVPESVKVEEPKPEPFITKPSRFKPFNIEDDEDVV